MLAGIGKDLLDEFGRPRGVVLDVHQVLEGGVGGAEPAQEQIGKADDRGQEVVEIVSDAAREFADCLQLLPLHRLFVDHRGGASLHRRDNQIIVIRSGENYEPDALIKRPLENGMKFHRSGASEAARGKRRDFVADILGRGLGDQRGERLAPKLGDRGTIVWSATKKTPELIVCRLDDPL